MIVSTVGDAKLYYCMHSGFKKAFEFFNKNDLINFEPGRYNIEGDKVFALVSSAFGKGERDAKLEAHRKYIDIQFCLRGSDYIGYRPISECRSVFKLYDADKDIEFYTDSADSYFWLNPGSFAVFFPFDAHAPLAGEGDVFKVVIKILIG